VFAVSSECLLRHRAEERVRPIVNVVDVAEETRLLDPTARD
jgi:hypothetical protein